MEKLVQKWQKHSRQPLGVPAEAKITMRDLRPAIHIGLEKGGGSPSERTVLRREKEEKQKEVGRELAKTLEEKV